MWSRNASSVGSNCYRQNGEQIEFGGGALRKINNAEFGNLDARLKDVKISVACDVTNPLTGPKGASVIFGPQKGATSKMVAQLDENLEHFATILLENAGFDVLEVPGSGAAGGLAAALMICGGTIKKGIDLVLDAIHFNSKLDGTDYIFTGEGKIDNQTPDGKVIAGIVKRARHSNVPVIAFAGSVSSGYEPLYTEGLLSVHSISQGPMSLDVALKKGKENLTQTVENVTRLL